MLQELILPYLFRIKYFADCHYTATALELINLKLVYWFILGLAVKSAISEKM